MAKKKIKCKRKECEKMFYPKTPASKYHNNKCRIIGRKRHKIARAIEKKKEERAKIREELKREALNG